MDEEDSIRKLTQAREGKVVHMSVENSNHTAPIHLDDDAEQETVWPSRTPEEQMADTPAVQQNRPQIGASRTLQPAPSLPARKVSTRRI
jgi:hypothetical protein